MTLPHGWASTTLAECQGRTNSLDPRQHRAEEFDLFSVPSYSDYEPEAAVGAEIGSAKQIVREGDVLLCKIVPHIRRGWVVPPANGKRQIASGEWIVFRDHGLEPQFLRRFVLSDDFHEQFMRTVSGVGGSLMRARPAEVGKIVVPVPPLAEQRRIVAKLDALTAHLARARAELDRVPLLTRRLRESALTVAFSAGVGCQRGASPADGAIDGRTKPLHEIPADWSWHAISSIGTVSGGLTKNSSRTNLPFKAKYIRVANVYADKLILDDVAEIGCTISELSRTQLETGDILIVEGNGSLQQVGRAALWDNEVNKCTHQNHIIKLRVNQNVHPRYALMWLLSPLGRAKLEALAASTSGLHTLSISKIAGMPIPLAPIEKQQEVVVQIDGTFVRADRLEAEAARARALLDRLEAAILGRAFRGELVPQDPNDEPASAFLARIRAQRAAAPKAKRGRKAKEAKDA